MNPHTSYELAGAMQLRQNAETIVAGYVEDPQDLATARLTLLAEAIEQEMRLQKDRQRLMFVHEDCLKSIHKFVTTGREDRLFEELSGMLESIDYGVK